MNNIVLLMDLVDSLSSSCACCCINCDVSIDYYKHVVI